MIDDLLRRRVLLIAGKGGVGRTRATATLARMAVARGLRTLIMETDSRAPIAAAHGKEANFTPIELAPQLFAMLLDRQKSLEEYLSFKLPRTVLEALRASALYQYFVQAAPGLRELMMMGKIYNEIERRPAAVPRWDVIVVDLPASGHALGMLGMPFAAEQTFGKHLVGNEAAAVGRFLRDPALCACVIVTLAEPLAVAETIELEGKLAELELEVAAIICNKTVTAAYGDAELDELEARGRELKLKHLDLIRAIAREGIRRREREQACVARLRRRSRAPLAFIPESPASSSALHVAP